MQATVFRRLLYAASGFVRDQGGISRIDCAVINLILAALIASGIYAYGEFAEKPGTSSEEGSTGAALQPAADTGFMVFGLPAGWILYGLLATWALVTIVRLVRDLRDRPATPTGSHYELD